MVSILLQNGADVNVRDHRGQTALHWATAKDCRRVVKCLLEAGASASLRANDSSTTLHIAAYSGHLEIATHLLTTKTRRESLQTTAGSPPTAEELGVVDLAAKDANGFTAEEIALLAGREQIVDAIRRTARGEDPVTPGKGGWDGTPTPEFHRPRPRLRLRLDPEADYLQTEDGISTVGRPLMNDDAHKWLCERAKLVRLNTGAASGTGTG